MVYLLDTSALLAHHRGEVGAERVQVIFNDESAEVLIASVSLVEFSRRLRDLGAKEKDIRGILSRYLQVFNCIVAVDTAVALLAFDIVLKTKVRIPLVDSLIAASALSQKACLVHRDQHMRNIPTSLIAQIDLDV